MSYLHTITTDVHNPVVPVNPPVTDVPIHSIEEVTRVNELELKLYPNGLMF